MKVYTIVDVVDYDVLAICYSRADAEEWILDYGVNEILSYSGEAPKKFVEIKETFDNGCIYKYNCSNFYAYMLLHTTNNIYINECEVY